MKKITARIIFSALLILLTLSLLVSCQEPLTDAGNFDYQKANLSNYISLPETEYEKNTVTLSTDYIVEDEDVEDQLAQLLFKNKTATHATDKPIQTGDTAFIYYTGYHNGETFEGGSNASDEKPYELLIGSGKFIDGFEDGLIDLVPSDTSREKPFELKVTFPDDYSSNPALEGEDVIFKVWVEYTIPHVTDKPIKKGDSAFIYYTGYLDGKAFDGGSNVTLDKDGNITSSPYELSIGSGSFIDGFEDGLINLVPSDTSREKPFDLKVTFPKDYSNSPELAGKAVTFKVWVEYTVQYDIPELTEDFVKNTLKYDGTIAQYKENIKKSMQEEMTENAETEALNAIVSKLLEAAEFKKLPEVAIDFWYNKYIETLESEMEYFNTYGPMYGYDYNFGSLDEFAPMYLGLNDGDDWQATIKEYSQDIVKRELIYHHIAKQQDFNVTDEEYNAEVKELALSYSSSSKTYTEEEIIEELGESTIKENVLFDKVEKLFMDNCTIEYKDQ